MLEEADNDVRRHYLATRGALIGRGYTEEDADRRAGVRIFDEPPGRFNLNTSRIAAASGTWDSDRPMADEYLSKMGHGYGNGFWGEPMEDVFRLALAGTEKVMHSSSTMVYGALDNDDFFMYMGGLAAAVRSIDGESPEMVVTNTRDPGRPEMTGVDKFIGAEFRTRYVNPTWIEGMRREGYAGAGEMRAFVEYLWGWDATVPETVDDAMWNESFAVYVEDRHGLDLKAFFDEHSPYAYQDITGRMVETIRKGYWAADDATTERLLREHVESVAAHGVACSSHTCVNPRLQRYVLEQGAAMNVPGPLLEAYRAAMEQATGTDIETAAAAAEEFVRRNDARSARPANTGVEGYRMTETTEDSAPSPAVPATGPAAETWAPLWVGLPVLGLLVAWETALAACCERVVVSPVGGDRLAVPQTAPRTDTARIRGRTAEALVVLRHRQPWRSEASKDFAAGRSAVRLIGTTVHRDAQVAEDLGLRSAAHTVPHALRTAPAVCTPFTPTRIASSSSSASAPAPWRSSRSRVTRLPPARSALVLSPVIRSSAVVRGSGATGAVRPAIGASSSRCARPARRRATLPLRAPRRGRRVPRARVAAPPPGSVSPRPAAARSRIRRSPGRGRSTRRRSRSRGGHAVDAPAVRVERVGPGKDRGPDGHARTPLGPAPQRVAVRRPRGRLGRLGGGQAESDSDPGPSNLYMLLAKNGYGKTTLLECIYGLFGLMAEPVAGRSWVPCGPLEALPCRRYMNAMDGTDALGLGLYRSIVEARGTAPKELFGVDQDMPSVLLFPADRRVVRPDDARRVERPSGFVYQAAHCFVSDGPEWGTTIDNLLIWLEWLDDGRLKELLTFVNARLFEGEATKAIRSPQRHDLLTYVSTSTGDHPLVDLSHGERALLQLYVRIACTMTCNTVVLIDEVEAHLHSKWMFRLFQGLKAMLRQVPTLSIVFTTHNRELIRVFDHQHKEEGLVKGGYWIEDETD